MKLVVRFDIVALDLKKEAGSIAGFIENGTEDEARLSQMGTMISP